MFERLTQQGTVECAIGKREFRSFDVALADVEIERVDYLRYARGIDVDTYGGVARKLQQCRHVARGRSDFQYLSRRR